MKKQSISNIAKRFFLGNLLVAAFFLSASAKTIDKATAKSADKVEVKYVGIDVSNLLSFNVKYSNPSGNYFNLVVLDENGDQLFKGYYADKKFEKTFKLPKSEVTKVTFVIEDLKDGSKEKFDVNFKTRVVEDVVISKG